MVCRSYRTSRRHGVILLVVMALLSLFAAVGIAFVIYAESAATSAKYNREAYAPSQPDVDPELIMNYFLSQFIYDTDNVYSALRGHSLARSLYGWNPNGQNETPFNGIGRLKNNLQTLGTLGMIDDYRMINLTYFPTDSFLRDPETLTPRASNQAAVGAYLRMANVPYTAPDMNNIFLAMLNSKGEVLEPSYYRSAALNVADAPALAKYTVLYPHSGYHQYDKNGNGTIEADEKFPDPGPGGHVKVFDFSPGRVNPSGGFFANDSYWVPFGFPVLEAKDGRKFTALVAVGAIDLDGKVNLNAGSSVRADGSGTISSPSNRGYGPWEINLSRVFPTLTLPATPDWARLFTDTTYGRYGADSTPSTTGAVLGNPPGSIFYDSSPQIYAQTDLDGWDSTNSMATTTLTMPTNFAAFPTYSAGYENGNATERTNHPALYNPIYPSTGSDRRFAASQMEALLRYSGTGSPAALSELFYLSPQSFNDASQAQASRRGRNSLTTDSWDFGRPGASPWLTGSETGAQKYSMAGSYPTGGATTLNYPVGGSEYATDFGGATRALIGSRAIASRLLFNRPNVAVGGTPAANGVTDLPEYPAPDATTYRITNVAAFTEAQKARQNMAKDIFDLLRKVTMGQDPTALLNPADEPAHAWLAQLAVNIVDFRDIDDYMTPFKWDNDNNKWVYGFELPKLVINEAYSEVMNDPAEDPMATMATLPYHVNFWVELLNPMPTDGTRNHVRLQIPVDGTDPAYAVYKLSICEVPGAGGNLFVNDATGEPDNIELEVAKYENTDPAMFPVPAGVDTDLVLPVNGNYSGANGENQGFYLLGPVANFPVGAAPMPAATPQATLRVKEYNAAGMTPRNAMMHTLQVNTMNLGSLENHNVFLRRLACPHMKHDPIENPYITVDYIKNVRTWDGVKLDSTGVHTPAVGLAARHSIGRRQPYSARMVVPQIPDKDSTTPDVLEPLDDQPQHTFFKQNGATATNPGETLQQPFDWLVHLDRYLVSPMELLHVSGVKPYEVTQHFVDAGGRIADATNASPIEITTTAAHNLTDGEIVHIGGVGGNTGANGVFAIKVTGATSFELKGSAGTGVFTSGGIWAGRKHSHQAPWLKNDARIYRFFEYVDAGHRASGVSQDGRIPGKVNINTLDYETFLALCDPNSASTFPATEVQQVFNRLVASRKDRPFRSLSTGSFAASGGLDLDVAGVNGIDHTLLRSRPGDPNKIELEVDYQTTAGPHSQSPALRYELLSKIFNNVTTRSNVFAVWVTVGFFEVLDDKARPVKLGPEIGAAQNRQIRHRMFAIIDRSQLRIKLRDATDPTKEVSWTTPVISVPVTGPQQVDILVASSGTAVTDMATGTFLKQIRFNTLNGRTWTAAVGSTIILDADTVNEEAVTVVDVKDAPLSITVVPSRPHDTGTRGNIIVRGNMGPWTDVRYDMKNDTDVVRYFSVIK